MSEQNKESQKKEKANWNVKPYLAMGLVALLVLLCSISYYFLLLKFDGVFLGLGKIKIVLQPIIFGAVFAYLMNPLVKTIEKYLNRLVFSKCKEPQKKKKLVRMLSIALALIFVILVLSILIQMVFPQLYVSIEGLILSLPEQFAATMAWIKETYQNPDNYVAEILERVVTEATGFIENWIKTDLLPQTKEIITQLTSGVYLLVKAIINALVGLIISVYLLADRERFLAMFKKLIYAIFKPKQANIIVGTVRKSHQIFIGFISGKILDSAIIGVICFVILRIVNMPYALLVSVIVGVTNVIPFFGPYIGAIPSFLIILLADPMKSLYFLIIILIIQQFDGNILGPKILGDSTGLSAFWVIFAILIGGGFFGVVGMFIGVPVFAVIYYIMQRVLGYLLRRKNLPEETDIYEKVEKIDERTDKLVIREEKQE